MNKKGFTLIELLAVIVILAIIALIATPAVLNIIEDSRKGAAEASARNIVSTAKTYYMSEIMNGRTVGTIDLSGDKLKYDGDQATKGTITFENGKASGKMYVGGYCVEVAVDGKVTSEKKAEDECEVEASEPVETTQKLEFPVADGQPVYFNPNTGLACNEKQVETNVNNYKSNNFTSIYDEDIEDYVDVPTITGLKEGCMKWYAFLDSEDSSTVNLILDHNTTGYVAWNENDRETPDTVNAELQADITNWTGEAKSSARLISASEVHQIAPTNPNWSVSDYNTWYYLHTGTTISYTGAAGSNTYAWLIDNTGGCTTYGCNVADSGTYGYWTSSYAASDRAWFVYIDGLFRSHRVPIDNSFGVRPVITVSKSIFD